jgi:hypothetical protein
VNRNQCPSCGKPYPIGQSWCNWCEFDPAISETKRPDLYDPASFNDPAKARELERADRAATIWLLRWMAILFGMVLLVGGGLLCSGGGRTGDGIASMIVFVILAFGAWLIYFAFTPKSSKKSKIESVNKESDLPDSPR